MKVLILSCSTGEGHNSAARAVSEELSRQNIVNEIVDPVLFKSQRAQNFVSSFYNKMIQNSPSAFGKIYKAGELYDSTGIRSPVYLANALYAENLCTYICENQFDTIISTHLYGMEAMTVLRKKYGKSILSYGVLTDYTIIPFLYETVLDGYFIPHDELRGELTTRGIPDELVFSTGIPVSAKFNVHLEKSEARQKLNMPQDKKIFLVMSGGIGGGNVLGFCDALISRADDETELYVLVGKNDGLQQEIMERYSGKSVTAVPFTPKVNIYMNASDVLLSKPGGLSSTEAAVANVPLVHINAIPGCENENIRFFEKHGMSIAAKSEAEAAELAMELVCNPEKSERMRTMQRLTINPNAAGDIVRTIMR